MLGLRYRKLYLLVALFLKSMVLRKCPVCLLCILLLEYLLRRSEVKHEFGSLLLGFRFEVGEAQFADIKDKNGSHIVMTELYAYKVAAVWLHGYTLKLLRYTLVSEFLSDHQAVRFALQHPYTYPPKAHMQDVGSVPRRLH